MATETFPSSLPNPSVSYGFDVSSNKIRTKARSALYTNRQRSDVRIYNVDVKWLMNEAEILVFRDWFRDDISEGSEIFDIDLFLGDGIKTNEAKFVDGKFSYKHRENLEWDVTASLEVWDADVSNLLAEYYSALTAAIELANPIIAPPSPDINLWLNGLGYTNALSIPLEFATVETYGPVTRSSVQLPLVRAELESYKPLSKLAQTLNLSDATLETGSS